CSHCCLHSFPTRRSSDLVVILTYESFPSEIQRQMKSMGWDVQRYVDDGNLQFIDCYSALVGGETSIKDPIDFTEVSIQVSSKVRSEEHTSELQSRGHLVC